MLLLVFGHLSEWTAVGARDPLAVVPSKGGGIPRAGVGPSMIVENNAKIKK